MTPFTLLSTIFSAQPYEFDGRFSAAVDFSQKVLYAYKPVLRIHAASIIVFGGILVMIRDICKDPLFLSLKSEPAGPGDLDTARDLLETLEAHH